MSAKYLNLNNHTLSFIQVKVVFLVKNKLIQLVPLIEATLHTGMWPQGFLYTSHLVSQNVKKACSQELKFDRIDNYCFIAGIKWNAFCFVFNCRCMAVTNTMSTSTFCGSSFDIYYSASSFTHLCFQTPSVNTNTVKKEVMSYYYYENSFDSTYTLDRKSVV